MKNKKYSYDMIYESRNMLFGIAAILVLMVHAKQYVWPDNMAVLKKIFAEGVMGVDIFLLLSGVGLYRSYANAADINDFYKRRMRRILPAFIPLALVFYAIIVLQRGESLIDYLLHVSTLSYWVKNETCTWYVSYIIIFYLLYPIIYKMIHKIPRGGGGVIAAVGIEFLLYATGLSNELLATAISRILITVIGAYVGKWAAEAKTFRLHIILLMLIPFFVIRIFRILFVEESFAEEVMYLVKSADMFLVFSFVLGFSIVCKYVPSVIKKFLEWLGGASLEIYLIHNFIGAVYHGLNVSQNVLIYFLLIVPFSVVIAKLYRHTVVALEKKH